MSKSNGSYGPCTIEHCPNDRRKISKFCSACSASFNYWDRKGPGAVLHRQAQLEKWQDRIQYLGTSERKFRNVARKVESRRA